MRRTDITPPALCAATILLLVSVPAGGMTRSPRLPSLPPESAPTTAETRSEASLAALGRGDRHYPYRDATLTVRNPTSLPIRAVRLRSREGGPAMQFPLAIAPGGEASRKIFLPTLSAVQKYDIALLTEDEFRALPRATVGAEIHWPIDFLTREEFLSPDLWREHHAAPSSWNDAVLSWAFLAGIWIALACSAVLLLRRPGRRAVAWLAALCLSWTAAAGWWYFAGREVLLTKAFPGGALVQARRTGEYTLPGVSWRCAPIYAHADSIREETLIVHPRQGLFLTLSAGEKRLFRECVPPVAAKQNREPSHRKPR